MRPRFEKKCKNCGHIQSVEQSDRAPCLCCGEVGGYHAYCVAHKKVLAKDSEPLVCAECEKEAYPLFVASGDLDAIERISPKLTTRLSSREYSTTSEESTKEMAFRFRLWRNMVIVAHIDGTLADSERDIISNTREELGIGLADAENILLKLLNEKKPRLKIKKENELREQVNLLQTVLSVTSCDGVLHEAERRICNKIALGLANKIANLQKDFNECKKIIFVIDDLLGILESSMPRFEDYPEWNQAYEIILSVRNQYELVVDNLPRIARMPFYSDLALYLSLTSLYILVFGRFWPDSEIILWWAMFCGTELIVIYHRYESVLKVKLLWVKCVFLAFVGIYLGLYFPRLILLTSLLASAGFSIDVLIGAQYSTPTCKVKAIISLFAAGIGVALVLFAILLTWVSPTVDQGSMQ